jgi:hypothetical protein
MDKQELKQLIKNNCNYSDSTVNYLVDNTEVKLIPIFTCNKWLVNYTSISKHIDYFFNQKDHQQVLIDNDDVDTSDVMTKFKVGDVVYYFDKHHVALIRGQITSIHNKVNLTQYLEKGPSAYSIVGIKRLDEDVDFVCDCIRNEDLFLTLEDATQALLNNTFKLEVKRKQEA